MEKISISGISFILPSNIIQTINMSKPLTKRYIFKTFSLLLLLGFVSNVDAQFIHYTHSNMNPLMINPGNTGGFYGTARVNAILRDQDWQVASSRQEYQMINGSVDININGIGIKKEDWIAAGVNFGRQGITSNFVRQEIYPSIAYHYVLDKKTMSDLAVGFAVGTVSNTITQNADFVTRYGLLTGNLNDGLSALQMSNEGRLNESATDYSLGVVLSTPTGKYSDMKLAISMRQPFNPRVGLVNKGSDRLDRDFTAFFMYYTDINDRLMFKPAMVVNVEGKASRYMNLQANFSYQFNPEKDVWLNAGIGARVLTDIKSLQLLLGSDFGDTRVGLAFDLHFGATAPQNGGPGALELAFSKIIKIHKKPEPKPILLCPRI